MRREKFICVTIKAVGWVGARVDRITDILAGTVMSSGAGTVTVGRDIMLNTFDLRPV